MNVVIQCASSIAYYVMNDASVALLCPCVNSVQCFWSSLKVRENNLDKQTLTHACLSILGLLCVL